LFLLNDPEYRNLIRVYLDFPKLFGVFTDIDCPPKTKPKQQSDEDYKKEIDAFEKQLKLAKKAIITILKTWKGLIYLGNSRNIAYNNSYIIKLTNISRQLAHSNEVFGLGSPLAHS